MKVLLKIYLKTSPALLINHLKIVQVFQKHPKVKTQQPSFKIASYTTDIPNKK